MCPPQYGERNYSKGRLGVCKTAHYICLPRGTPFKAKGHLGTPQRTECKPIMLDVKVIRVLVALVCHLGPSLTQGHSKHEMWMRLCDLCAKHPEEVTGVLKVRETRRVKEISLVKARVAGGTLGSDHRSKARGTRAIYFRGAMTYSSYWFVGMLSYLGRRWCPFRCLFLDRG